MQANLTKSMFFKDHKIDIFQDDHVYNSQWDNKKIEVPELSQNRMFLKQGKNIKRPDIESDD